MSLKYALKWTQKDCSEIVALCKKYRTTIVGLADNHLQSISGVRQNEIHPYRQAIAHPYRPSTAHHNANDISYITRSKANINLIILQKNVILQCIVSRPEPKVDRSSAAGIIVLPAKLNNANQHVSGAWCGALWAFLRRIIG